jgi:hypothetical protein
MIVRLKAISLKDSYSHLRQQNCPDITVHEVDRAITRLKKKSAPGIDRMSAEHLSYGLCDVLLSHLSILCTIMFRQTIVPEVFIICIIVPVLKKSLSNPNMPENYRPITICSAFKLAVIFIMPDENDANLPDSQFGFRKGRGTDFCSTTLNDVMAYAASQNTPLFISALDAEKCFDRIRHSGLLYKFICILPLYYWLFMCCWCRGLQATVRFNDQLGDKFVVTRGTIR